jgi:hypothetical protein
MNLRRITNPPPQMIEAIGIALLIVVAAGTGYVLCSIPDEQLTRAELLRVLEVGFTALAGTSLLFLWAQLRHTGNLNKLIAYHEYFHDLPGPGKVIRLYTAIDRLKIEIPLWQAPLTEDEKDSILDDSVEAPDRADIAVREYLNDFEEFAAAVNSGLVGEDYAYHLESARTLNAYYGFRELIDHWLAEDQKKASRLRESGIATSDYYGELAKLADRWKVRKLKEATRQARLHGGVGPMV